MPSIFCAFTSVGLMGRPSSLGKVGCMALTSFPKSSGIDKDSSRKVVGYRMHGTRLQNLFESSLCSSLA